MTSSYDNRNHNDKEEIDIYMSSTFILIYMIYAMIRMSLRGVFRCLPNPMVPQEAKRISKVLQKFGAPEITSSLVEIWAGGHGWIYGLPIYPLVICYIAIENGHRNSGFTH